MALSNVLERLQNRIHGAPDWPPPELAEHWERIQGYRRRFLGRAEDLIPYATALNRTANGRSIFTPVPLAREIAAFSAAMLFSAPPRITYEEDPDLLDEVASANALFSRFHAAAERIAIEGRGALRVHLDESVSRVPQIHHVPEDRVLWEERHGDIVLGGAIVIERKPQRRSTEVYRLIESHEAELIRRTLYRGTGIRLGEAVPLESVEEFAGLEEELPTPLDAPTLYRWNNLPSGRSDLAGLETLLDRYDEGWSLLVDKMRKSVPVSFVDGTLFTDDGAVDLLGIIPLRRGNLARQMGDEPSKMAETVQPDLQSEAHIHVLDKMRETILQDAGYSLSSWGLGEGGYAESGTALRLKQDRTIQTKNAKEHETVEAMKNALACAMCWHDGGREVSKYRPEIKLADAMPRDEREVAQTAALWKSQEAISLEEQIRLRHPEWSDDSVDEEASRIRAENPAPEPRVPRVNLGSLGMGVDTGGNGAV